MASLKMIKNYECSMRYLRECVIEDLPSLQLFQLKSSFQGELPSDYDNSFHVPFVQYPNRITIKSS